MAMQETTGFCYEFAADMVSRDGSIPTISPALFKRLHPLRNHWFGPLLWQSGIHDVLGRRRHDAAIFLGDAAYLSTWFWATYCRIRGIRVLFWTIGWHRPERGIRRWLRLCFYNLADELLLYSDAGKGLGALAGYPASKMRVIGNSYGSSLGIAAKLSDQRVNEIERSLPPKGRQVVAAVVRIDAQRRFDLLLEAASRLNREGIDVSVLLVGEGGEVAALRQLASTLGVDLHILCPIYSNEHLRVIYDRILLTVVPAKAGLTVIQSMSFGRPVITTDRLENQGPEVKAISPGVTGDLYSDGSVEDLTKTIRKWLIKTSEEQNTIASECRNEVEVNWSATGHASAIADAVISGGGGYPEP